MKVAKPSPQDFEQSVPTLEHIVEDARAWRRETISRQDWLLPVPGECLAEVKTVLEALRVNPLPTFLLDPLQFPLSNWAGLMREVRRRLDEKCGVVVLDRLPVEEWTAREAKDLFWLIGVLLGRPVAQTIDGEVMVDITDTGIKKAIGVRGFRTNTGQLPHIDNSFNRSPPDYVSMFSLTKSVEGGESRFISFYTVHNELMKRRPDLLRRLYRPFYQDRQGDFRPGESQTVFYPIFTYDGELRARYTHFTIPAGYQTAGKPFEGETKAAFEAISELVSDPSFYCSFIIEPGQLQFVNNRGFGHGRTEYRDSEDKGLKRHLLRLWHRETGGRGYNG